MSQIPFTTPSGRLVQGNLYKMQDKDASGNPRLVKRGPRIGQPAPQLFFALAVPKGGERHWAETAWGALIWQSGHSGMPNAGQRQTFAWKIVDGDSTALNDAGKRPCDNEGFKGHWVIRFTSGYSIQHYTLVGVNSATPFPQEDAVKLGDWVQVNGSVDFNGDQQKPGVYINPKMVCLIGYGQRIVVGPDVASAGFGGSLPPGASLTPPGGFVAPVPPYQPQPVPEPAPQMAPAAAPYTGFMTPQPAVVAPQMTAKAQSTREQYHAAGWSDAQLIAEGLMTA
jgi:hypothetical protein